MSEEVVGVVVVGAGPAGLAAARALRAGGVPDVLVIDRERSAGGVPRHCHHTGFGLRDLHRSLTGPRYAAELVRRTTATGARIETETMATGWAAPGALSVTAPSGIRTLTAHAVVLATGARERPRAARLVAGDRGDGVFTTGQLQQWVYEQHLPVGHRAVVVGGEHVSYSAVLTLRHAGARTVAMVTEHSRHQTYPAFARAVRIGLRVPLVTGTEVLAVHGRPRVAGVELRNVATGAISTIDADTIVFTGDWVPDHELARTAGIDVDPGSKAPVVDLAGATSATAVYAAGNLVHPAETADIAALRGAAVGTALARRLTGVDPPARKATSSIVVEPPLLWAAPGRISSSLGTLPPYGLVLRTAERRRRATVVVEQGSRELARFRVRVVVPNRSLRVPLDWAAQAKLGGGPVSVRLT
ncbi:MAG TPA: FAD-dependent oxidoreductase [Mycobacteriales bacterium]|nr:FAD-dependent oxidoreductase [Mycobacteriales bacterium]